MTEENLTLSEKVDRLTQLIEKNPIKKRKERMFRMPFSGRVGRGHLKKGFVTVLEIAENGSASFTKKQIVDSTIKLRDTYHSVDDKDCLNYKGKPLIIIPKKSENPYNPNYVKNTTFSQKHIMSRMMNETINKAKTIGIAGISIGVVILVGIVIYALISG